MPRLGLLRPRLSEAALARAADALLGRAEELRATEPAAALRLLRRRLRPLQPALRPGRPSHDRLLGLLRALRTGGSGCPPVSSETVGWETLGAWRDLGRRGESSAAEVLWLRSEHGARQADLLAEAEALAAMETDELLALAVAGDGPPFVVRTSFLRATAAAVPGAAPALEGLAELGRLARARGLGVERF